MALAPGTSLGRYEVVEAIGGSDTRFKAVDRSSNRVVLVTLAPSAYQDAVLARLQRDAEALSALRHAHICPPIDIGHDLAAPAFVVTDFVEGGTLSERLARGPMEIDEALRIAAAVADALDQAHRKGIVHRQLTPSAIVLSSDGPKLLDFGLAAEASSDSSSLSVLITRTSATAVAAFRSELTRYAAPEQLDGRSADARSDIFALGAILYEMLAGRPAFDEKTPALLIAAVQTVDPEPISKVRPKVSPALEHLVERMLAKDPHQRIQTARDLLAQLRWVAEADSQLGATPVAARSRRLAFLPWVALGVGAVALAAGIPVVATRLASPPERQAVRFTLAGLPPAGPVPVSLSPDGRWLIGSPGGAGSRGVVAQSLDSVITQTLITTTTVTQPFWSPDGKSVGFFDDGHLKRVEIAGGTPQNVCDTPLPIGGGSWNRDGIMLFAGGGRIYRVLAAGGQPTPVTTLDASLGETEHVGPAFLPDGRHFLFLAAGRESGIYVGSIDSAERKKLIAADTRPVFAPGYVLFNRGNVVFAQPFDDASLTIMDEPLRVADGVFTLAQGPNASPSMPRTANFTVSQNGILAFKSSASAGDVIAADEQRSLVWFERSGNASIVATSGDYVGIDLSPDGRRFAVHKHEGSGGDIWMFDFTLGRMQRLTFDTAQENQAPIWSPDGKRVAFASRRRNLWGLYVKPADGDGAEELLIESPTVKFPSSWTPDGKLLVYSESDDIWAVPVAGEHKAFNIIVSPSVAERFPQVSPDGRWVAYQSTETGRAEIYVSQFPSGPGKWQVSTEGGQWPRWRSNGSELYFTAAPNVLSTTVREKGGSLEFGVPVTVLTLGANPSDTAHDPHYHRYAISQDGQRFLMGQPVGGGANTVGGLADRVATIADGGTAGGAAAAPANLTVVLNWTKLLRRK